MENDPLNRLEGDETNDDEVENSNQIPVDFFQLIFRTMQELGYNSKEKINTYLGLSVGGCTDDSRGDNDRLHFVTASGVRKTLFDEYEKK